MKSNMIRGSEKIRHRCDSDWIRAHPSRPFFNESTMHVIQPLCGRSESEMHQETALSIMRRGC